MEAKKSTMGLSNFAIHELNKVWSDEEGDIVNQKILNALRDISEESEIDSVDELEEEPILEPSYIEQFKPIDFGFEHRQLFQTKPIPEPIDDNKISIKLDNISEAEKERVDLKPEQSQQQTFNRICENEVDLHKSNSIISQSAQEVDSQD